MLWVTEKYVDKNKNSIYSTIDWYETKYADSELRPMLKNLTKEFGRVRSMWRNTPSGGRAQVGWVFEKRVEYGDSRKGAPRRERFYLREIWVEVSIGDPRLAVVSPWA